MDTSIGWLILFWFFNVWNGETRMASRRDAWEVSNPWREVTESALNTNWEMIGMHESDTISMIGALKSGERGKWMRKSAKGSRIRVISSRVVSRLIIWGAERTNDDQTCQQSIQDRDDHSCTIRGIEKSSSWREHASTLDIFWSRDRVSIWKSKSRSQKRHIWWRKRANIFF